MIKVKHLARAFDGEGARRYGGRWNSIGVPIVYTSDYLATAALELMVNMIDYSAMFQKYDCIAVEIPTKLVTELDPKRIPANWQNNPPPKNTRVIGDDWFRSQKSAVFKVPCAVIPEHNSFLINPEHPEYSNIRIHKPRPFIFDPRFHKHFNGRPQSP
jgi:RES domain-containing protein